MGDVIGYARVSTADQDPRMQLDALSAENCLKTYTDNDTGTKADRPQWNACLVDLRPGDTLVIWKIDRLGRNLRDLVDIVTTLGERHVGDQRHRRHDHRARQAGVRHVRADGRVRGRVDQRTHPSRSRRRPARGRHGGRKPKTTPALVDKAQRMYDSHRFTVAEIAQSCAVSPMTIYRHISTGQTPGR